MIVRDRERCTSAKLRNWLRAAVASSALTMASHAWAQQAEPPEPEQPSAVAIQDEAEVVDQSATTGFIPFEDPFAKPRPLVAV